MALIVNPMQPFHVRRQTSLSQNKLEALTQFYQPLIGSTAIGVYLTLHYYPRENNQWTNRRQHSQLIQQLNIGITEFDQARKQIEAVGLLRTFRDYASNEDWKRQTLRYEVDLPLDVSQFIDQASLNTALYHRLGDSQYEQLIARYKREPLNTTAFPEVTTAFNQVFDPDDHTDESPTIAHTPSQQNVKQANTEEPSSGGFDYSRFLSYIMAEGVPHNELTRALKQEVLALYDIYGINEMEATQIVTLATNDLSGHIQLEKIKEIANKRLYFSQKKKENQVTDEGKPSEGSRNQPPKKYTEVEVQARKEKLIATYPSLSKGDIQLILTCEQVPNVTFLELTKRAKNGFATDNEKFYVQDIVKKTSLIPEIINFLIYYLLINIERPNIYKGDLQRFANEWQQAGVTSAAAAIVNVKEQEKIKSVQQKQNQYRNYPSKRKTTYQEQMPSWMSEQETKPNTTPAKETKDQPQEAELRARLDQLFSEEGD